jgi:hypothetical protein
VLGAHALAILLSAVPVGAAWLAFRLARPLSRVERGVVAGAVALFALVSVLAPQLPVNDQWAHYRHLRAALLEPVRLLDPWDRPGFTLLYAGPAALGLTAARLASAVPAGLALVAVVRAGRALGLTRPWVAATLLAAQYDFFGQASSTMTELPFAASLAVAALGWAEERPWVVAGGLGWLAITRPEGPLLAAIGAAGLIARFGRPAFAAAAAVALPFAAYSAAGALASGDPLWLLRRNPYCGLVAPRLELRQLAQSYFYEALRQGQPPALIALEAAGAALSVAGPARRLRFLLAPVATSFLLLTFLRIGLTDGWRESRYLVAIAPALALLSAAGLEWSLSRAPRLAPPALLGLAAYGGGGRLLWHWRGLVPHLPWVGASAIAAALALAALLWLARRRVPTHCALALLLLLPLACAPPGAHSRHRLEGLSPHPSTSSRRADRSGRADPSGRAELPRPGPRLEAPPRRPQPLLASGATKRSFARRAAAD